MIYLLIDNCTLLHLVNETGYNNYLTDLVNYVNNDKIQLITHELLVQEWQKNKEKDKNRKERKLIAQTNNSEQINNLLPIQNINTSHLESQFQQIDTLLSKAKILTTPDGIKNEFAERFRNKLAPFHNKKDSQNDWEIIGSACNHCEIYNIKQLYFLSYNHTDFADIVEINRTIHPTLQERFPNVKIHYYKNYSDFFNEIDFSINTNHELLLYNIIPNQKFSYNSTQKNNVLDSLYYLYNELYGEISFIPLHILRKYFPFATSEKSNVYYNHFTIYNVNDNLIAFFQNIEFTEDKEISFKDNSILSFITDYKVKTEFVLKRLTNNLVFNICDSKRNNYVNIHYNKGTECSCYRCSFNRFEFHKTFKDLKVDESELRMKLKLAYTNYKVGNFKTATELYYYTAKAGYDTKNYLTYFIAKYNLKQLRNLLSNIFYNKEIDKTLIDNLSQIDPIEEAVKLKGLTDYDFVIHIAQGNFFSNAFQNISEEKNEIITHYYSQLKGGWSSNQHIWSLIEEFAKLETFLNSNLIIYDSYSNFEDLFELVTEGIFASHALAEDQNDRFKYFDSYWIQKFILYGNKKHIIKYFRRYHLKSLKYKVDSDNHESFTKLFDSFLKNEPATRESFNLYADKDNEYFFHKYSKIFENIVTLATLLDLDDNTLNKFSEELLNFLKSESSILRWSLDSVNDFIEIKGQQINSKILYQYFEFYYSNEKDHDGDTLNYIIEAFKDETFDISEDFFSALLNQSVVLCQKCGQTHSLETVLSLYDKVDKTKKIRITEMIQNKLEVKNDFNAFYLATLYNIIPFNKQKLFSIIDNYKISGKQHSFRSFFSSKDDYRDFTIDKILNLCFKFNVNTKTKRFEKIKNKNIYYNWLLNMEEFDYKNFNPLWILNFPTIHYFKTMSKSKKLIQILTDYLKDNFHEGIERTLIRITYFSK